MASIGNVLTQPETGFTRYNFFDTNISYDGNWVRNNNLIYTTKPSCSCSFNFTGNKLYIIGFCRINNTYDPKISIYIDKKLFYYSAAISNAGLYVLMYKNIELLHGEHSVIMKNENYNSSHPWWQIMAIDIDANGELKPYNENPSKYLIKQNNQYYTLQENGSLYLLGIPEDNAQLENWFNTYGISNINDLCNKYNLETYSSQGESLEEGKLFTFDIPNNMKNINNIK